MHILLRGKDNRLANQHARIALEEKRKVSHRQAKKTDKLRDPPDGRCMKCNMAFEKNRVLQETTTPTEGIGCEQSKTD